MERAKIQRCDSLIDSVEEINRQVRKERKGKLRSHVQEFSGFLSDHELFSFLSSWGRIKAG